MQKRELTIVQSQPLGCDRVRLVLVSQDGQGPNLDLEVGADCCGPEWSADSMAAAKVLAVNLDGQGRGTVTVEC